MLFVEISANGSRIGDNGEIESRNFQSCINLSNKLLSFSEFIKKGKT